MIEEYHSAGWSLEPLEQPFGWGVNFQIELKNIAPIYERLTESDIPLYQAIKDTGC